MYLYYFGKRKYLIIKIVEVIKKNKKNRKKKERYMNKGKEKNVGGLSEEWKEGWIPQMNQGLWKIIQKGASYMQNKMTIKETDLLW